MSLSETLYEAVLAGARPAIRAAALVHGGAERAVRGRAETLDRFREWSASERQLDRPLLWVHAPSVGEALMAKAVIAAVREARPDVQVAFTHFSPSAERMVEEVGADVAGYVPFDTRGPVREALSSLRPAVIAFVRTEVWPVLSREAARAGASQVLVNAVLSEGSGRLRWLGRSFLEGVYRRLDRVGAVSREHAERYERLGVPSGADPGHRGRPLRSGLGPDRESGAGVAARRPGGGGACAGGAAAAVAAAGRSRGVHARGGVHVGVGREGAAAAIHGPEQGPQDAAGDRAARAHAGRTWNRWSDDSTGSRFGTRGSGRSWRRAAPCPRWW